MNRREARSSNGTVIGYTKSFRAPDFTGRKYNYIALRLTGEVVGMAQPTEKAAVALLLKTQ